MGFSQCFSLMHVNVRRVKIIRGEEVSRVRDVEIRVVVIDEESLMSTGGLARGTPLVNQLTLMEDETVVILE